VPLAPLHVINLASFICSIFVDKTLHLLIRSVGIVTSISSADSGSAFSSSHFSLASLHFSKSSSHDSLLELHRSNSSLQLLISTWLELFSVLQLFKFALHSSNCCCNSMLLTLFLLHSSRSSPQVFKSVLHLSKLLLSIWSWSLQSELLELFELHSSRSVLHLFKLFLRFSISRLQLFRSLSHLVLSFKASSNSFFNRSFSSFNLAFSSFKLASSVWPSLLTMVTGFIVIPAGSIAWIITL